MHPTTTPSVWPRGATPRCSTYRPTSTRAAGSGLPVRNAPAPLDAPCRPGTWEHPKSWRGPRRGAMYRTSTVMPNSFSTPHLRNSLFAPERRAAAGAPVGLTISHDLSHYPNRIYGKREDKNMRSWVDSAFLTFVLASLRDPRAIGALVPSGRPLAVAMAQQILNSEQGTIVELGPGTGAITAALFDLGVPEERLCLIECNRELVAALRKRFPSVRVIEGDATHLRSFVERIGLDPVAAVVSSLPLKIFDQRTCKAVLEQSFEILGAFGSFTQFTYNPRAPISPALVSQLGLVARKVARVWLNLPPASIWQFRRAPLSAHPVPGNSAPRHTPVLARSIESTSSASSGFLRADARRNA